MVTAVSNMVTKQFEAADLVRRLTEERASNPEVEIRLKRVENTNRRIGEVLADLEAKGLKVSTEILPGLGQIISDTTNLGEIEKTPTQGIFEGVTELTLLIARKLGDFIAAVKLTEPNPHQFDIKINDQQTLSLIGPKHARFYTKTGDVTNELRIYAGSETAMQDCETPGPANVLRTNSKFDSGFTPGTQFEEGGIYAHKDTTVGTGSHAFHHYPGLNVRLGRGLTCDGGLGDQAYTALLNLREHPSGKYSDESRAFATKLAQTSPVDEVALPAQFLNGDLVEDFKRRAESSFGLGVPVRPRPYSREEFLQVTAA